MSRLFLTLLFVVCFSLATKLAPTFEALRARRGVEGGPLLALLGDSRRLFANQFFAMADVYYHSGYYPTIFDAKKKEGPNHLDVATQEGDDEKKNETGGKAGSPPPDDDDNFMGKPKDWVEEMGRHFIPTVHTHLTGTNAQEILPWLKLSAEMDPKRVDTYVTAAYWLRTQLHQPGEAEEFLRQGLRANPDSYEILLELGRVYFYDKNQPRVARNIWEAALDRWNKQALAGAKPDPHDLEQILGELVRDDEKTGDLKNELTDLEALQRIARNKEILNRQIQDLKAKLGPR